jgi:hypothetical protein
VPGGRSPAYVLLEMSTESERVARRVESFGRAVLAADPPHAPIPAASRTTRRDLLDDVLGALR